MTVALFFNKTIKTYAYAYLQHSLKKHLEDFGITVISPTVYIKDEKESFNFKLALFFDKDAALAKYLECCGVKVINSASAIEICDCKQKTYLKIGEMSDIVRVKTIFSPLYFKYEEALAEKFLDFVENEIGYPVVVKPNVGSLGLLVKLIYDRKGLKKINKEMYFTPHQYQRLIESGGEDTRLFVLGGEVIECVKRKGSCGFISNLSAGGEVARIDAEDKLKDKAKRIASLIGLEYCAIDFLKEKSSKYYFLEANSNAFFYGAEKAGANISKRLAEYALKKLKELRA